MHFAKVLSLLLLHGQLAAFSVATAERNLQNITPQIQSKIDEVQSREFTTDKFCSGYDSFGLCSMCYDSYLDFKTKRCVAVARLISNCQGYDKSGRCQVCEFGFRIAGDGERCRPNDDPDCLVENSKGCEVRLVWVFFLIFGILC